MKRQLNVANQNSIPMRTRNTRPTPMSQTSVNLEDMVGDAKTIDEKLKELVSLSNCLGQRNDNSVLRNELERAIRDLDGLLSSMDSHLKELEENAKKTATKSELKEIMKTITRYRRDRDRNAAIFQEHKDRITSYMNENPLSKPAIYMDPNAVSEVFNDSNSQGDKDVLLNEIMIKETHQDVAKIAVASQQLNSMMRDLSQMVSEQGEYVDVIERNTTRAAENTKQGVIHLNKAAAHQRATSKRCCTFFGIVLAVAVLIVICIILISVFL